MAGNIKILTKTMYVVYCLGRRSKNGKLLLLAIKNNGLQF